MNVKEMGYVVLDATDIEAWRRFAGNVLGAMVVDLPDGGIRLRLDERDCRLLIRQADVDRLVAVGWFLTDEDQFLQARYEIESAGCEVFTGSSDECVHRRVNGFFAVTDPAGHRHEIAWGPLVNFRQAFVSPVGVPNFVTTGQGLGHIVLDCTPDQYRETRRFWQETLGFKVANIREHSLGKEPVRFPVAWYHCGNPRQHSLGLAPVHSLGTERHGCRHIQLEVPSIDDVGLAYDRAERNGVRFASTLGRHVNDRAISFYMTSPSKCLIEYACGAPPRTWEQEIVFDEGGHGSVWGHKWLPMP